VICDETAKEKVVLDQSYRDSNVVVFWFLEKLSSR